MTQNKSVFSEDERIVFSLRELYEKYGYSKYRMSKFEEYDFYVRNKDFLISDSVITFTDINGRLMALKPDVTLSIIKNCKDEAGAVSKLYYNENVYRVTKGAEGFREIMQAGLECIGDIDDYCVFEVCSLAMKSLLEISGECVLDISHIGILSDIIDEMDLTAEDRQRVIKCISEKNLHEINAICGNTSAALRLKELVSAKGSLREVISKIRKLSPREEYLKELEAIVTGFENEGIAEYISIDFSVVDDIKYYNGIVFKGFIQGAPTSVLSGGRYDNLMKRIGKDSGAIGFAVYLDVIKDISKCGEKFDTDVLLVYNEGEEIKNINRAISQLSSRGERVSAQRRIPDRFKYKRLVKVSGEEITEVIDNA